MIKCFLSFSHILLAFNLFAQKQISIEPAIIECQYRFSAKRDTITGESFKDHLLTLRIGESTSCFFSNLAFRLDSLRITTKRESALIEALIELVQPEYQRFLPRTIILDYIYKNYPVGKTTYQARHGNTVFSYEESFTPQDWVITDSIKNVFGYECRLGICEYRGRDYYAWFTKDIPISEGPWKFNGLPGLILEVYDKDNHYSYEIIKIRQDNIHPVFFCELVSPEFALTTRKELLRILRKSMDYYATEAILSDHEDSEGDSVKEAAYDFQERDYE